MAPKNTTTIALFLALNLVLLNMGFASYVPVPRPMKYCPEDTLKLHVCADVLDLLHVRIGTPQWQSCCSLIRNIIKLDAAACLCTAVHADVLGLVHLNLKVDLTALVNYCGCKLPNGFICPPHY